MADGVDVDIVDGVAELTFRDHAVRGQMLTTLLELGGAGAVKVDTGGTRRTYLVSEELAGAAGLIDRPKRRGGSKSAL